MEIVGNANLFYLLSKAFSEPEGWMKSTKAMEIPGIGCVVQVTTQQGNYVAEALTFVPGVKIQRWDHLGGELVPLKARLLSYVFSLFQRKR